MEFVDGPTLASGRSGKVVNERHAAILLETVGGGRFSMRMKWCSASRLKPSNILLSMSKDSSVNARDLIGIVPCSAISV